MRHKACCTYELLSELKPVRGDNECHWFTQQLYIDQSSEDGFFYNCIFVCIIIVTALRMSY